MKAFIACGVIFLSFTCGCSFGGVRGGAWQSSYFDGKQFRRGAVPQHLLVYQRQGFVPVVGAERDRIAEVRLPEGMGSVVIYCYVESLGGKIQEQGGSIPVAQAAIDLEGKNVKILVRGDKTGYAIASLPAGSYTASVGRMTRTFSVTQGETTLLPIRAGKRMVD